MANYPLSPEEGYLLSKDMVANGMGKANVSALYSPFGTIFCILDNHFVIKLPLISAYFEGRIFHSATQTKTNPRTQHQAEPLKQSIVRFF